MRHRVPAVSAVLGTLLLAGCRTSTVPGSSGVWHVIREKAPAGSAASGSR